jgi:hypothetical protein
VESPTSGTVEACKPTYSTVVLHTQCLASSRLKRFHWQLEWHHLGCLCRSSQPIARCKTLASLSLAHNHLCSPPPEIAFCAALAELSVRNNALVDIRPCPIYLLCNGWTSAIMSCPVYLLPWDSPPRYGQFLLLATPCGAFLARFLMVCLTASPHLTSSLLSAPLSQARLLTIETGNSILTTWPACSCKPIPCTLTC